MNRSFELSGWAHNGPNSYRANQMPDRTESQDGTTDLIPDARRWWPIALIAPAVFLIRLPGVAQAAWAWLWLPVGLALLVLLLRNREELHLSIGVVLFGGYLGYSALSLLWSPDPGRGLRFVGLVGVALLAFLYGRRIGPLGGGSHMWRVGLVSLGIALAGLVLFREPAPVGHLNPDRILAMGAIALAVLAWYGPRSRIYTLGVGLFALGIVLASGSRTASVVMIVLLITAPGLRLPRTGRLVFGGSVVALVLLLSITPAFQQRWFESGEGAFWDMATLEDLETSGRTAVWPVIGDSCRNFVLGEGAGAADSFAFETNQGFPEPHNEYLRIWCDTGLVGSVLFWGFVALVGSQALTGLRTSKRSWSHNAAAQMVVALLVLSATDNPLTTAVPFMIPAALVVGWAEQSMRSATDDPDDLGV